MAWCRGIAGTLLLAADMTGPPARERTHARARGETGPGEPSLEALAPRPSRGSPGRRACRSMIDRCSRITAQKEHRAVATSRSLAAPRAAGLPCGRLQRALSLGNGAFSSPLYLISCAKKKMGWPAPRTEPAHEERHARERETGEQLASTRARQCPLRVTWICGYAADAASAASAAGGRRAGRGDGGRARVHA